MLYGYELVHEPPPGVGKQFRNSGRPYDAPWAIHKILPDKKMPSPELKLFYQPSGSIAAGWSQNC
jgi:hypothetical protein